MYYRNSSRQDARPIRLPEHYSGNAFSDLPPDAEYPPTLDVGKPTLPEAPRTTEPEPLRFRFPPSDELLLVGLILLLSQDEGNRDAVTILSLLLFCG